MGRIKICSSMALDAICFIDKSGYPEPESYEPEDVTREIAAFASQLPPDFGEDGANRSIMCDILCAFSDNMASASLDDLIEIFKKPEELDAAVRNKIWWRYHPVLDGLKNGAGKAYVHKLGLLKQIDFEGQYRERVLPKVEDEIDKIERSLESKDADALFKNVTRLKNRGVIESSTIYVAFFSSPISFALPDHSYLTHPGISTYGDVFSTTAHELMHGFASAELTQLYLEYVAKDAFLTDCHDKLINYWREGDEEEFVCAAEFALVVRSGYKKAGVMDFAKQKYGGCCPVAAILFDFLSKEPELPEDYNRWLIELFKNGKMPTENIREYVCTL